jgi:hypothetical protein
MITKENFTRVNNDINGNPRYTTHFLTLITDKDKEQIEIDFEQTLKQNPFKRLGLLYDLAVNKSKTVGGKKYRSKEYGGGIVFQSYNLDNLTKQLNEIRNGAKNI